MRLNVEVVLGESLYIIHWTVTTSKQIWWTLIDEPLCKLCQTVCKSNNAKMPEFFEDLFCNLDCYEEYRLRTSNRGLREGIFQFEHGVGTNCYLDCHKLVRHIKPLSHQQRQEYIKKVAPQVAKRRKLVHLVELCGSGELFAMKAMDKGIMLNRNKESDVESFCSDCGLTTCTSETGTKLLPTKQTNLCVPKREFQNHYPLKSERLKRACAGLTG